MCQVGSTISRRRTKGRLKNLTRLEDSRRKSCHVFFKFRIIFVAFDSLVPPLYSRSYRPDKVKQPSMYIGRVESRTKERRRDPRVEIQTIKIKTNIYYEILKAQTTESLFR